MDRPALVLAIVATLDDGTPAVRVLPIEQPRICRKLLCLSHSAIASFLELFNPSALRPCHYAWWRCCSIQKLVGRICVVIAPSPQAKECRDWPLP
jgi:hypothetical protein